MRTIILLAGFYNVAFALFHLSFWKIFHWNSELKKLSFASKAIMQILNVQLICYFTVVAMICFIFPTELHTTSLGQFFLGAASLFWMIRAVQQFIFLGANHYKIHILTIIFLLGALLFALPVIK